MKAVLFPGLFVLSFVVEFGASVLFKNQCPPSGLIHPCKCVRNILTCTRISDSTVLGKVMKNSAGYKYDEVQINRATLQYLPKDLFNQTEVKRLIIQDSKLVALFNNPPSPYAALEAIHIVNSRILRGYWELMSPFTNLQFLKIQNSLKPVSLDNKFAWSLSKSLNTIIIDGTEVQKISTGGAFRRLVNLKKLTISNANLRNVHRDDFPHPFKVKDIDFSNNKLTSIPRNLISQMPELRVVNLNKNKITSIPEEFNGRNNRIVLLIKENPLKCDCNLVWTAKNATSFIDGACENPENLKGQRINDLWTGDFEC